MHYKLSKNEWLAIGNKAGWLKSAKKYESLSKCRRNCPDLDVDLRQECKNECEREYGDTAKKKTAAEIKAFEKTAAKAEFAMKVDMPELRAEFLGFDVDSNGNKIARFKKYSGETVRIQTNGNLPKSHRMTNQSLDAKAIEQEVLSSSYASKFALKPRSSRPGTKTRMTREQTEEQKTAAEIKAFEKTAAKLKLVKTFPAGSNNLSAKIYRDSDYNGYLVRFFENGKHREEADYDTQDLQEAIGTAEYSISHYKAERTNEKTAAGPDGELLRKLRKIYAYVANEANDISDNQWNKWKISVDAGMSSDNTEARRFAKLIKAIVVGFKSGGSIDPNTLQDIDPEEVREGDDDRYYSGTGEPMGNGPDDDSYTRYLDRG